MKPASFGDSRLPDRFWRRVLVDDSGCWLWTGCATTGGYTQLWFLGRQQYTHRVAYSTLIGAIPEGLQLDHLCRVRNCCNPAHLEPVTRTENARRADHRNQGMHQRRKTHCPRNHPYSGSNLYTTPTGSRQCKACRAERKGQESL